MKLFPASPGVHVMIGRRCLGTATVALAVGIALWASRSGADNQPPTTPKDKTPSRPFAEHIRPILARHCLACHGADKPKGDFRIDQLSPDFADAAGRDRWQAIVKRVQAGEMPPKGKPRPSDAEVRALTGWVRDKAAAAEAARSAEGRAALRRLNRVEYENTVRDLLGVEVELKEMLPLDGKAFGFDNVGEGQNVSSFLMERYLEAADVALEAAVANAPRPKAIKKRYDLRDERHVKITTERVFRKPDDGLILFSSSAWQTVRLDQFYPPDRGRYRFRIAVSAVQSAGKPVGFRVAAGRMLMASKTRLVGYFDAPADKPAVIEFVEYLESRSTISLLPYGLTSAQAVHKIGADKYEGPGLKVQWVEVEGPLHDAWPPASHRRIFGDLPQTRDKAGRFEVVSKDPDADAARILRAFARRAFRRSVTDEELKPYLKLFNNRLAQKQTFEQAVRVGLKAILVSPQFLFLRERPGKLDDFALASRLSYFLWSTTPDEELLNLAEQKKLGQPDARRRQVERMLKDPKAAAFTENFVGQWLGLRDIDATAPDPRLYPEFDELLKVSMLKETYLFFDELLKNDLSLTNFVSSEFTMLNGRLAKHYGIPGVEGYALRKTKLPADSKRGGVLTMASVLTVTANGTNTSPVVRGAWVLDRILGQPPPPPPDGVPAVEPDIRGATTIREQLAKHRSMASCASCHARIDPPGFALESYDVIGGWREHYRSLGRGQAVTVEGRRMPYHRGLKVDPADVLPDGRRFSDIVEFKKLLLADRDQLARALAERLVTYATGAPVRAGDRAEIGAIVGRIRGNDYGLRALVHAVVASKLFQHK